ncbi:hypothetical protein K456DRAFT_1527515 [Colletotrichum gloeosporioides 23]|nr:hypothetical protein K456DRAFT_1527515 [Colletotrichum gloeosporioides 23]
MHPGPVLATTQYAFLMWTAAKIIHWQVEETWHTNVWNRWAVTQMQRRLRQPFPAYLLRKDCEDQTPHPLSLERLPCVVLCPCPRLRIIQNASFKEDRCLLNTDPHHNALCQ